MKKLILEKGYERHGAPVFVIKGGGWDFFRDVGEDIYRARKELNHLVADLNVEVAAFDRTMTDEQRDDWRATKNRLYAKKKKMSETQDDDKLTELVYEQLILIDDLRQIMSTYTEEDEDDDS